MSTQHCLAFVLSEHYVESFHRHWVVWESAVLSASLNYKNCLCKYCQSVNLGQVSRGWWIFVCVWCKNRLAFVCWICLTTVIKKCASQGKRLRLKFKVELLVCHVDEAGFPRLCDAVWILKDKNALAVKWFRMLSNRIMHFLWTHGWTANGECGVH